MYVHCAMSNYGNIKIISIFCHPNIELETKLRQLSMQNIKFRKNRILTVTSSLC